MSMLETSLLFGGQVVRSIDLATGEIIAMRQQVALSSSGGGSLAGDRHVEASLSTCHISPKEERKAEIRYRAGASVVKASRARMKVKSRENPYMAKRETVKGYSRKSKNRLMRQISEVKRERLPVFVTLTYPKSYPNIAETFKRDIDVMFKRLLREYPEASGVWKLEPQKRGAPHFHLLVWGVGLQGLQYFIPQAWYEVVGSGDPLHLSWHQGELGNKHCVQPIHTPNGVMWYVAKYMSKEVIAFSDWGRWWGVFHRSALPLGELIIKEVTDEKAIEFIRYMERFMENKIGRDGVLVRVKRKKRVYKSLTIICNADFWINRLL